jgi:hypothetical protein
MSRFSMWLPASTDRWRRLGKHGVENPYELSLAGRSSGQQQVVVDQRGPNSCGQRGKAGGIDVAIALGGSQDGFDDAKAGGHYGVGEDRT